mmetsp:Transcript_94190/g.184701  ORF Transcript_94190/g.184701 Transcript_94190/m.184701 type:complete len:114 (+) Transcript_94190:2-343(+)
MDTSRQSMRHHPCPISIALELHQFVSESYYSVPIRTDTKDLRPQSSSLVLWMALARYIPLSEPISSKLFEMDRFPCLQVRYCKFCAPSVGKKYHTICLVDLSIPSHKGRYVLT